MQEEQHIIGFDYQRRYDGNCGQRSLMHALLLLGHPVTEDEAHRLTDRPRWKTRLHGTNEHHMKLGIRRAGFRPLPRMLFDRAEAVAGDGQAEHVSRSRLSSGRPGSIVDRSEPFHARRRL